MKGTALTSAHPEQATGGRRELARFAPALVLLTLAVLINYVDRGSLALAAPLLKGEWHVTASQLGILFSAFFWSYVTLQFVMGWLVDRFNVNVVMGIGFVVWSLSTAAAGLTSGFATMLVMRLMLGAGESVMFPASSKMLAQHLPEHSRGFANGVICAAMLWGSAVGTLGGGLLMAKYGWRAAMIAVGLAGLLWLPAWIKWKPGAGALVAQSAPGRPSVAAILQRRSFWGAAAAHFSANYLLYFLISWLPYYLVHERQLSIAAMASIAGLLYMANSAAAVATGWVTDRVIRRGGPASLIRKSAIAIGFAIATVALGGCALAGPHTYLGCLLGIGVGSGMAGSGSFAFGQTLAGPWAAGRWIGLQNGFANLAGIVGPPLTGFLIDRTGHFGVALAVASAVALAGAGATAFGVGRLEPVQWPSWDGTLSAANDAA